MSILDKATPSQLEGGLNKDLTYQKPGDVTFALNAIRDSHDGGKFEYQSEPGNEATDPLKQASIFMGEIYGQNNERYIFSTEDTTDPVEGYIGIFKEGRYKEIVKADFGWNPKFPITGEYRIRNGCERIIYWCNGDSPDGWFNIDKPELFQDSGGNWILNNFNQVSIVSPPKLDLERVETSGGNLPVGSYMFQLEVLDSRENQLYVGDVSPQVPIYDESQDAEYYIIDGALNYPQFDPIVGGVLPTNKSIVFTLSNLDTSFAFIRVNVFRKLTNNNTTDGHVVAALIPITSDTITWTYTGYNIAAGDYPIDVSEKLIDNIVYESAYVMEQVQGRLLKANLKASQRDYSAYQAATSDITMKWVSEEVESTNQLALGNSKNPNTYWYKTGFQGDEVYLPGIRYLHDDGTWSPTFPLIGRAPDANDLLLLTVVADASPIVGNQVWLSDVQHLGLVIGDTVEKWKVFNTATITSSQIAVHPYSYEGEMAYYESDELYPEIKDCDNNLIWGGDIDETTKVRFIKFPDRRLVSHMSEDGAYIRPFGIKFDNIVYPSADIVGHQWTYIDRSSTDRTVLDSGWAVAEDNTASGIWLRGSYINDPSTDDFVRFNSASSLFNKQLFSFDYYKINRAHTFQSQYITNIPGDYATKTLTIDGVVYSAIFHMAAVNSAEPERTNHEEISSILISPFTITTGPPFNTLVRSFDPYTGDTVSKVSRELEDVSGILGNSQIQFDTHEVRVHNFYTYKKVNLVPYTSFLTRQHKYINFNFTTLAEDQTFYGGDVLISETVSFRGDQESNVLLGFNYIHHFEEHAINPNLRVRGTTLEYQYFREGVDQDGYNFSKATTNESFISGPDRIKEYYGLNNDYTLDKFQKTKLSLTTGYDYCSSCQGYYANRIIFSPKSFDEENFDLYRVNKINDYIDLPGHRGAITGLSYQNNMLLVHCEDATFILQPNPQSLATNTSTVYLTTGDFLSIPPAEIRQTDTGWGGMQSKQHQCDTPFGHVWADQRRGTIQIFDQKIDDLSSKGMTQWFKENLPSELKLLFYQVFADSGLETSYPNISTYDTYNNGIGLIMYYDPRFKRLMMTKKDYQPINFKAVADQSGELTYNHATDEWKYFNGTILNNVYFSDPARFRNKSWTLSYSFEYGSWTSFHSYRPLAAFSDDAKYYTIPQTGFGSYNIYRHEQIADYQRYYGTRYDFIVEWMVSDQSTDSLDTIHYSGYTLVWDKGNEQWLPTDLTFNKGLFYNHTQSTGLVNLILSDQHSTSPYSNLASSNTNKYVIKTDQNYKISNLYDLATNIPVNTSNWTSVQTYPGYIDMVPSPTNINFNKTPYQLGNINDKFVICRLFFNPIFDCKKVINLLQTNESRSIR